MFTKDSRTENFLTQMGVEFRYTNSVKFSELADGWEERNIGRPVPIREAAVMEYATLMETGSAAPAPILFLDHLGFEVLDGVQRLAAARLIETKQVSAYLVTTDSDDTLAAIRVLANARLQGRPEPPEWTRRKAVEVLVLQRGLSVEEVARMGGWKPSQVSQTASNLKWASGIEAIGGPVLPDAMIETVAKYATQDNLSAAAKPVAEFLHTVKQAKFSSSDAEPYIAEFFDPIAKTSKSFFIYESRLGRFKREPEVEARVKGRKSPGLAKDVNLRRSLKAAETILDEIIMAGDELRYVDEFFQLVNSLDRKLHELSPKHQKATTAAVPADMWSEK